MVKIKHMNSHVANKGPIGEGFPSEGGHMKLDQMSRDPFNDSEGQHP